MNESTKAAAARRAAAETLALRAMSWMAADPMLIGGFLAESGSSPAAIAQDLHRPAFLAAVLDYVLAEDQRVLALAENLGIRPQEVAASRALLPGGDLPNWT